MKNFKQEKIYDADTNQQMFVRSYDDPMLNVLPDILWIYLFWLPFDTEAI